MTLKQRHKKAHNELRKIATKVLEGKESTPILSTIADKLDISSQTIYNYIGGRCKDGFLTESLTEEFKKMKPIK